VNTQLHYPYDLVELNKRAASNIFSVNSPPSSL
jgi:hypothetical protein